MRDQTRDGLTKDSTLRERVHYRRHGVWPASYLKRVAEQHGGSLSVEETERMAGIGLDTRRALRKAGL